MDIKIQEIKADLLDRYSKIPIRFEVSSMLQITLIEGGLGGIALTEKEVEKPYVKDYDSYETVCSLAIASNAIERWSKLFDISKWGFFLALDGEREVGGITLAFNTPGVYMLSERTDISLLWDLRVHPEFRRHGIGTKLFEHAIAWSKDRSCRQLKIETQNINVPACRFYAKQGCKLGMIDIYGYAGVPEVCHETMLVWYFDL